MKEIDDEIKGYLRALGFSERDFEIMKQFDFKLHDSTVVSAQMLANIKGAVKRYDNWEGFSNE